MQISHKMISMGQHWCMRTTLAVCLRQTDVKGKNHFSVDIAMQTSSCSHCADSLPVHDVALMDVDQSMQQRSQHLARNEALCQALPTHTHQSLLVIEPADTWPTTLVRASLVASVWQHIACAFWLTDTRLAIKLADDIHFCNNCRTSISMQLDL